MDFVKKHGLVYLIQMSLVNMSISKTSCFKNHNFYDFQLQLEGKQVFEEKEEKQKRTEGSQSLGKKKKKKNFK